MSDVVSPSENLIVVGVDGSDESKQALRWADYLAGLTGSSVTAVAAWTPLPSFAWAAFGTAAVRADLPKEAAQEGLTEAVREVFGPERSASIQTIVRKGNPAQVLIDASANARMLVLGTRGLGGFTGLLLGSVSSACAEHAKCPVFIVHGTNPPAS